MARSFLHPCRHVYLRLGERNWFKAWFAISPVSGRPNRYSPFSLTSLKPQARLKLWRICCRLSINSWVDSSTPRISLWLCTTWRVISIHFPLWWMSLSRMIRFLRKNWKRVSLIMWEGQAEPSLPMMMSIISSWTRVRLNWSGLVQKSGWELRWKHQRGSLELSWYRAIVMMPFTPNEIWNFSLIFQSILPWPSTENGLRRR